jgi:hypothetical protein
MRLFLFYTELASVSAQGKLRRLQEDFPLSSLCTHIRSGHLRSFIDTSDLRGVRAVQASRVRSLVGTLLLISKSSGDGVLTIGSSQLAVGCSGHRTVFCTCAC